MNQNTFSKNKQLILIAGLSLILIVLALLNFSHSKHLSHRLNQTSGSFATALELLINSDRDLYQAHTASQNYLIKVSRGNQDNQADLDSFKQNALQALQRMIQARELLLGNELVKQEMSEFEADYNHWLISTQKMLTLAENGRLKDAVELNNSILHPVFLRLRKHYDVMGELARTLYNQSSI